MPGSALFFGRQRQAPLVRQAGLYSTSEMLIPHYCRLIHHPHCRVFKFRGGPARRSARTGEAACRPDFHVRYHLEFAITPQAATTSGEEELRFSLKTPQPVLLDFRDGRLLSVSVNGVALVLKRENGHLDVSRHTLRAGENTVRIRFTIPIAAAGKPLTRFDDHDDNSEYIYSLFVPMDASMAFPCFDQPDLKARFALELTTPEDWTVISNTAVETFPSGAGQRRTHSPRRFRSAPTCLPSPPVHFSSFRRRRECRGSMCANRSSSARRPKRPRCSRSRRAASHTFPIFSRPFPFPKYDMVLIPGLPYGGMEHAGATFLREESVLFRTAPTHSDLLNRDILVLHELTHQWFGDLVTMRWFDDLWLKEGFAQYMAYQTLAALQPDENVWKRFYESIKPDAYAIDSTKGTTPIYQEIPNLRMQNPLTGPSFTRRRLRY